MESIHNTTLRLSITETEFLSDASFTKNQLVCYINLNDQSIDNFSLSNHTYKALVPFIKGSDKISVILRKKESNEIIGCISFRVNMFYPIQEKNISQW